MAHHPGSRRPSRRDSEALSRRSSIDPSRLIPMDRSVQRCHFVHAYSAILPEAMNIGMRIPALSPPIVLLPDYQLQLCPVH